MYKTNVFYYKCSKCSDITSNTHEKICKKQIFTISKKTGKPISERCQGITQQIGKNLNYQFPKKSRTLTIRW